MIAAELHISPKTVKNHISNILMKLQIDNRIQAAVYAVAAESSSSLAAAATWARAERRSGAARRARGGCSSSSACVEPLRSARISSPAVHVATVLLRALRRAAARAASARPRARAPAHSPRSASLELRRGRASASRSSSICSKAARSSRRLSAGRRARYGPGGPSSPHTRPSRPSYARSTRARACARTRRVPRARPLPGCLGAARDALERRRSRCPSVLPRPGAVALDLETGATVYSRNALAPRPASNEKLAVTYAALNALGPAVQIETDVLGEGEQAGATWRGDLVLKGYGDPTLSSPISKRSRGRCARSGSARRRAGARRRVVVRLAPDGARLEGVVLHLRVAAALGVHRRSRPVGPHRATPRSPLRSFRAALLRAGVARGSASRIGRALQPSALAQSTRRRCRDRPTGWTASATTSSPRCS